MRYDLHDDASRAAEHFRRVHLLGTRGRDLERAGRGGARQVRERVLAFGQAGREELDAVVVAFDMVETAALPPILPADRGPRLGLLCEALRGGREGVSTGSNPAGSGSTTAT